MVSALDKDASQVDRALGVTRFHGRRGDMWRVRAAEGSRGQQRAVAGLFAMFLL